MPESILPYSGIIYFVVILTVSHFFWKFTVLGDETDQIVTFFGLNISAPFNFMATHVANVTAHILKWLGYQFTLTNNTIIYSSNVGVHIVWACSGLKQAYIFTCIIGFYRGSLRNKVWFIPIGLLVVYIVNVIRITAIAALIKDHPDWFYHLHEHLFKYLFYAIIFGMWVIWEEKFSKKSSSPKPSGSIRKK